MVVIKLAIVIVVLQFYNSFYCILDGRAIALAVTIDAPIKKLDWADIGPVRAEVMLWFWSLLDTIIMLNSDLILFDFMIMVIGYCLI